MISSPIFSQGNVDTDFIPRHYDELFPKREAKDSNVVEAVLAVILDEKRSAVVAPSDPTSPFATSFGSRTNHYLLRTIKLKFGEKDVAARVVYESENTFRVTVGEKEYRATGSIAFHPEDNFTELTCNIDGNVSKQRVLVRGPSVRLFTADGSITFEQRLPKFLSQQG